MENLYIIQKFKRQAVKTVIRPDRNKFGTCYRGLKKYGRWEIFVIIIFFLQAPYNF